MKCKKHLGILLLFMGGFVAGINAAMVFPNPIYDAQGWKIAFALFLAIPGGCLVLFGNILE